MTVPLPRIVREADIAAAAGARVEVCGVYAPIDLRRLPKPPPQVAHVVVQLVDGATVLLEPPWRSDARRSDAERARYQGRSVRVVGTLHGDVPEQFAGAATVRMPCLVDVESIELAPE